MNRYTASALMNEAVRGRSVLVVTHNRVAAAAAFDEFRRLAPEGSTIRRSSGLENITTPTGGRISFTPASHMAARGRTADIIYLERDAELILTLSDVMALSATAEELVRA